MVSLWYHFAPGLRHQETGSAPTAASGALGGTDLHGKDSYRNCKRGGNAFEHGQLAMERSSHEGATGVECGNLTNDPNFEQLAGFRLLAWGLEVVAEDAGESRLDKRGWDCWQKSNGRPWPLLQGNQGECKVFSHGDSSLTRNRRDPTRADQIGRFSGTRTALDWAGNRSRRETDFLILVTLGNI